MTYFSVYLALVFSKFIAANRSAINLLLVLWIAVLVVFVGTREWTGCDFGGYLNRFNAYSMWDMGQALASSEKGFILLNYLVIKLGLDYMWLNVFAALIFFFCIFVFVRRRENGLAFLALCFPILVIQLGMSGLRQALATSILMLAWNAFVDGRRVRMVLIIVLAAQFHSSAVMFLPLVLLAGREVSTIKLGAAIVAALPFIAYLSAERLEVYQTRYVEGDLQSLGAIFRIVLAVTIAGFFELFRSRYKALYPEDFGLMRAFSLFSLGLLVLLPISSVAAHRVNYYILPVQLLMVARLPAVLSGRATNLFYEMAPFVVYGTYMTVWYSLSRHARLCYHPYESYLF